MARFAAKRDTHVEARLAADPALSAPHAGLLAWKRVPPCPSRAQIGPHSQPSPLHHRHRRSFREKSGLRFAPQHCREIFSVQSFDIALKCRLPNLARPARNQLADENHASPRFASRWPSDVKPQVHFIEIRVHRDRQEPEQFCFQKSKSDKADKNFVVPAIEFGSAWDKRKKQIGVHFIVQHGQMLPFCGEKNSVGAHIS